MLVFVQNFVFHILYTCLILFISYNYCWNVLVKATNKVAKNVFDASQEVKSNLPKAPSIRSLQGDWRFWIGILVIVSFGLSILKVRVCVVFLCVMVCSIWRLGYSNTSFELLWLPLQGTNIGCNHFSFIFINCETPSSRSATSVQPNNESFYIWDIQLKKLNRIYSLRGYNVNSGVEEIISFGILTWSGRYSCTFNNKWLLNIK